MSRKTFTFKNSKTGATEVYDEETGELLSVENVRVNPVATLEERMVKVDLPSGKSVFVDPLNAHSHDWEYSKELGQKLCDELLEGKYLVDICDGKKFPPFKIVSRWKRTYPEFAQILSEAFEDRAELFSDKIRKIADETNEDNSGASQVKINAYKHLASVDNPKRFQPKNAQPITVPTASTIVIVTGISREEKEVAPVLEEKKDES